MLGQSKVHANFSVDDLQAAKDFYVGLLGFKLVKENEFDIMLEAGHGTRINIYQKPDHTPWNATVLGIEVDDLRGCLQSLKELGVDVEKIEGTDEDGIMSDPDLGDAAWFKDPARNWVCIGTMV